jgi:hypothetical protein
MKPSAWASRAAHHFVGGVVTPQGDVGPDRVVEQERLLEDQGGALGYLGPVEFHQAPPVETDGASIGIEQTNQQVGDGRLARAGGTDQRHGPTGLHLKRDRLHAPRSSLSYLGRGRPRSRPGREWSSPDRGTRPRRGGRPAPDAQPVGAVGDRSGCRGHLRSGPSPPPSGAAPQQPAEHPHRHRHEAEQEGEGDQVARGEDTLVRPARRPPPAPPGWRCWAGPR